MVPAILVARTTVPASVPAKLQSVPAPPDAAVAIQVAVVAGPSQAAMRLGRIAAFLAALDEVDRTHSAMAEPVTVLALEEARPIRCMAPGRGPTTVLVVRDTASVSEAVEIKRLSDVVPLAVAELPEEGPTVPHGEGLHAVLAPKLVEAAAIAMAGLTLARRLPVEVGLATGLIP